MNDHGAHHLLWPPSHLTTLAQIVRWRAVVEADQIAYTFLADGSADARSITWSQLDQRARALAGPLVERGACGQSVMLALPSGLAFVESLFACWYAGAIALPVSLPRHQRVKHRLDRIVADAGARFAMGTAETRRRLETDGIDKAVTVGLTWIAPDAASGPPAGAADPRGDGRDVALLQYTSGSTGAPRGVVVTHANLMANSALIAEACGHRAGHTIGGWLPLFHDMGLVGMVLQAAASGSRCVFMSPERFLMRPRLWLQMISDYQVSSSPAPNFAYDLCVDKIDQQQMAGLDLSSWRNALNGSEAVRAATLDRFANAFACCGFKPESFFPCYGLAEATLFVAGPNEVRRAARRTTDGTLVADQGASTALSTGAAPALGAGAGGHVGCGTAFGDTKLAIVDPQTRKPVARGAIGEIWVAGASIAQGYWNNPEATAATFDGRLAGAANEEDCGRRWLRTGDLGFIAGGELFITGRLRELIIIAGRNLFPVDLERTAESADPAIATHGAAAFSVDVDGVERLILAAEVRREYVRPARGQAPCDLDVEAVRRRLRGAVAAEHDVAVHEVVLLCPGALPRTTSGKLSRRSARDAYLGNSLERFESSIYDHAAH